MRAHIHKEGSEDFDIDPYNISTYGGEGWIDDFFLDEYGIQIGDLSISEITSKRMKELGVCIINHLLANGHLFEFYNDNQGNGKGFRSL